MFKTNIDCGWGLISFAQIAPRVVLLVEPKPIKLAHDSVDSCDAGQKTEMVRFREDERSNSLVPPWGPSHWLDGPGAACSVKSSSLVSTIKLKPHPKFWCKLSWKFNFKQKSDRVFFSIWRILTACFLPVVFVWYWYYLDIIWFLCNWVSTQLSPLQWLLLSRRWGLG